MSSTEMGIVVGRTSASAKGVGAMATMASRMASLPVPQRMTLGSGLFLTVLGVAGFAVTGFDDFVGSGPDAVLGLRVNPLQNLIYLTTGVVALASAWNLRATRVFGFLTGIVYLVVFALGAPSAEVAGTGPLNANTAATVLHMLVGFMGVAIAQSAAYCERYRRREA